MPELPEVETVRRDLLGLLVGRRIEDVWTSGKPLHLNRPVPVGELGRAVGQRVTGIRRQGKFLLVDHDDGLVVVVHLGMTGRLSVEPGSTPRPAHTHVVWVLDTGDELRFRDARRFGMVQTTRAGHENELASLARLGIDPLGPLFTAERLHAMLRTRSRDIKSFFMDQRDVTGVGNIYVSEALHRARIHPRRQCKRISARRAALLVGAVRDVLGQSIANRGTTLRDYIAGDGRPGNNQRVLAVYGREGQPCLQGDGGLVRRIVQSGRSTFYCPRCQR